VTLFPTDQVEGARLCVEFSAPKVMFGENASALSSRGARVALGFVLDELESVLGQRLHGETWSVYRLDVARTLPLDPATYLPQMALHELSRRERIVYESGVRWQSQARQEVVYDKHAELVEAAARLAKAPQVRDFPDESGLPDRAEALARALDLTAGGGLRVEVRVRGSHNVRTSLALERATFDLVVTDTNAATLLGRFLAQFAYMRSDGIASLSRALAADGTKGRRLLQLVGLVALNREGLTQEQSRDLLGLRRTQYRHLQSRLDDAQVHLAGEAEKNALVVTREDLARTEERDKEMEHTWLERRKTWRRSLNLSPYEPGLLEELP
jgi:hypothetical protein